MHPNRVAMSSVDGDFTYAELDERSDRLANSLSARGCEPGESSITVLSENRAETVTLAYACAKIGCLFAPLN